MKAFEILKKENAECKQCNLHEGRTEITFGRGAMNPILMIVASHPHKYQTKEYFDFIIAYAKERCDKQVWLTNALMCDTEKYIRREYQDACNPRLIKEIKIVNPTLIVTMGATALFSLVNDPASLNLNKQVINKTITGHPCVNTIHPLEGSFSGNKNYKDVITRDLEFALKHALAIDNGDRGSRLQIVSKATGLQVIDPDSNTDTAI